MLACLLIVRPQLVAHDDVAALRGRNKPVRSRLADTPRRKQQRARHCGGHPRATWRRVWRRMIAPRANVPVPEVQAGP